jgi:septation ring formation regulator EzrA
MLRKMLIGFAILFLLLVGAGVYLYLKVQPILYEAEARKKMLQPRPIKGEGNFERSTFYTGESLGRHFANTCGLACGSRRR